VSGDDEVFMAPKEEIVPTPFATSPIEVLSFVQLNIVPATALVNTTVEVLYPLHHVWSRIESIIGVGLTVIVKIPVIPLQLLAAGVIVIVAVTGAVPLLIAVNEGMSPEPLAAKPIDELLFVQLKTVPATEPENRTSVVGSPLHKV
jgi:hypothetical protein